MSTNYIGVRLEQGSRQNSQMQQQQQQHQQLQQHQQQQQQQQQQQKQQQQQLPVDQDFQTTRQNPGVLNLKLLFVLKDR